MTSWAHVQGTVSPQAFVQVNTVTLANNPTVNNTVCVGIYLQNGTQESVINVQDSNGNNYVVSPNSPSPYESTSGQSWLAYLSVAPANSTKAITVTLSGNDGNNFTIWADEFSYVGFGTPVLDSDSSVGGSQPDPTTAPIITVTSTDLLYASGSTDGTFTGASSPWVVNSGGFSGAAGTIYALNQSSNLAVEFSGSGTNIASIVGMSIRLQPPVFMLAKVGPHS